MSRPKRERKAVPDDTFVVETPKAARPLSNLPRPEGPTPPCPRCAASETKFCYYNNYNVSQPRYFCKACERHWTAGGSLRKVEAGAGRRNPRGRRSKSSSKSRGRAGVKSSTGGEQSMTQPSGANPGATSAPAGAASQASGQPASMNECAFTGGPVDGLQQTMQQPMGYWMPRPNVQQMHMPTHPSTQHMHMMQQGMPASCYTASPYSQPPHMVPSSGVPNHAAAPAWGMPGAMMPAPGMPGMYQAPGAHVTGPIPGDSDTMATPAAWASYESTQASFVGMNPANAPAAPPSMAQQPYATDAGGSVGNAELPVQNASGGNLAVPKVAQSGVSSGHGGNSGEERGVSGAQPRVLRLKGRSAPTDGWQSTRSATRVTVPAIGSDEEAEPVPPGLEDTNASASAPSAGANNGRGSSAGASSDAHQDKLLAPHAGAGNGSAAAKGAGRAAESRSGQGYVQQVGLTCMARGARPMPHNLPGCQPPPPSMHPGPHMTQPMPSHSAPMQQAPGSYHMPPPPLPNVTPPPGVCNSGMASQMPPPAWPGSRCTGPNGKWVPVHMPGASSHGQSSNRNQIEEREVPSCAPPAPHPQFDASLQPLGLGSIICSEDLDVLADALPLDAF